MIFQKLEASQNWSPGALKRTQTVKFDPARQVRDCLQVPATGAEGSLALRYRIMIIPRRMRPDGSPSVGWLLALQTVAVIWEVQ